MVVNKIAENVLGTIGTVCWSVQVIPQIWKSYRSKSTDGLSEWLIFMWGISGPIAGVYIIVQNLNVPLILQPHALAFLFVISWTQCLFYGRKWPLKRCIIYGVALLALMAGCEMGIIYAVKYSKRKGSTVPLKSLSIMNSVFNGLGFIPQYWEIYKRKEVTGISITFLLADICGGVFSILSLAFKQKFDVFASVSYAVIVVMDMAIVIAALVLNPMARRKRAARSSELVQVAEVPAVNVLTSGIGGSNPAEKSDLELGEKPIMAA
ncbi:PQ loop repeat-domain-containing protein [Thelephora terrestris]|uniref:PQ loop repeat-domain-containing protein n=1 Tax=Thelephora terrestris TaxID=56493 RepID=A0A9P6L2Y5_9AGAM|nr:PQ loop repeat-domain-containing protein [Thelephora terrestris]